MFDIDIDTTSIHWLPSNNGDGMEQCVYVHDM